MLWTSSIGQLKSERFDRLFAISLCVSNKKSMPSETQTRIFIDLVRAHLCPVWVLCVYCSIKPRCENKSHWERALYLKLIWIFWTRSQSDYAFSPWTTSHHMLGNQSYFHEQLTVLISSSIKLFPKTKLKSKIESITLAGVLSMRKSLVK